MKKNKLIVVFSVIALVFFLANPVSAFFDYRGALASLSANFAKALSLIRDNLGQAGIGASQNRGTVKIGNLTYKPPVFLQDDEFAVIKSGNATGEKRTATFQLKSGAVYTTEIYENQSISILESEGNTRFEINDGTEIHNLAELYDDSALSKAKVSPVASGILKKKDTVPVIIRFGGLEKQYMGANIEAIRKERKDKFNAVREKIKSTIAGNGKIKDDLWIINGISANIKQKALEDLQNDPNVQRIGYDATVHTALDQSLGEIFADGVWNNFDPKNNLMTGIGMRIAILDTGVDYRHPDLGGCFGADCKVVQGYDFENNDDDPMDDNGHGTHVAAIAAGKGKLNGVAPDARIYSYKVLNFNGSGSTTNVIKAIQRATDPNGDGNTNDHVDVGNMSLGSNGGSPGDSMSLAVDNSSAAGVVWAIAATNFGPSLSTIGSPGCAGSAVTVAAACKTSQIGTDSKCAKPITTFSSRGPVIYNGVDYKKPDVAAPGHLICAAEWSNAWSYARCIDTEHVAISGTSMATPHVAGALALMRQAYPSETVSQIKERLKASARDLGVTYNDQGAGEINLKEAIPSNLQLTFVPSPLWETQTDPTQKISVNRQKFSVTPTVDVDSLSVAIQNPYAGVTVTPDKTLLNVAGKQTDTLTLAVTVDNDVVDPGSYSGISAILNSGGVTRGVISIALKVKPSLIISLETTDYGVDNPTLASWTSAANPITFTNLRTDISRTLASSISGLPAGAKFGGFPGQITIDKGAALTLNTTISVANNAVIANGFYDKLQFKFTSGNLSFAVAAKFYKAYYLDIISPDQNPESVAIWDYEKKATLVISEKTYPKRIYFMTPGKTDLIFRFTINRLPDNAANGVYVKEGVDLNSGSATVTLRMAELANVITLTGTSETNAEVPIYTVATSAIYRKDGLFTGGLLGTSKPVFMFNNVSSNFISYAYYQSIQPNPEKVYFFGWEQTNGISSSQNVTNTPQDLKFFTVKANSNLAGGAATPLVFLNGVGNYRMPPAAPPASVQKIYYTGFILPNVFLEQKSEVKCSSSDTEYCPTLSVTPSIELSTGKIYYPSVSGGSYCSLADKIENGGIIANSVPVFFAGQFSNYSKNLSLTTVNCPNYGLFRGQDYSRQLAPDVPYSLKNSSGTVVASGVLRQFSNDRVTNNFVAGTYTFEIPSRKYFIRNNPYYASVTATIKKIEGQSDYNPPAIGKLNFYADGQKSEEFIPNTPSKIELILSPVGGTLAAQKVSYSIDGSSFIDAAVSPGSPVTTAAIAAQPDSAKKMTVRIYAADSAGNDLTYKFEIPRSNPSITPSPDATPPTASITAPADASIYTSAQTVNIAASVTDNIGISKVEFYDGATLKGADTVSPYEYSWTISAVDNGNHSLTAKAYDAAGNYKISDIVAVTVNIPVPDTTLPSVNFTSPANGAAYTTAKTVSIAANANDNVGVAKVQFYDGTTLLGTDTTSPYSYSWAITSANNGTHSLTAKAYDAAGNNAKSTAVSVTVNIAPGSAGDTAAPTVLITAPANGSAVSGTVAIGIAASDNVGVAKVSFYINGAFKGSDMVSPYSYSWNTAVEFNGMYTIYAVAYDAAGNSKNSATISAVVNNNIAADKIAPTVTITVPATGSTATGKINVKYTVSDNVGVGKTGMKPAVDGASPAVGVIRSYSYSLGSNSTVKSGSYSLDTLRLANGSHIFTVTATDAAGNTGKATVNLVVNNAVSSAPWNFPDLAAIAQQIQATQASLYRIIAENRLIE